MRRPFLCLLVLLSLYCWLSDVVAYVFFCFHLSSSYQGAISTVAGIGGVLVLGYALKDLLRPIPGKAEWGWLLLASLPIIGLGLFRSVYPDQNFDTFHFELYLQDYKLPENKLNFAPGAIRTYYFPLPERMFAWCRHLLGYRLGALLNTFLLVTILASVGDFIRAFAAEYLPGRKIPVYLPALLSLVVLMADNTFFNIGSYKPDLLGIPVLLELLYIVFFQRGPRGIGAHLAFFGLVALTVTYKLTYLPYAGVLAAVYYVRYFRGYTLAEKALYPLVVLVVPAVYLAYNYQETANPVWPFFNTVFHSPSYPNANFKDERWGPRKAYETFIYPVVTCLDPSRCNEWSLFSYRLLVGYVASLVTVAVCLWRLVKRKATPISRFLLWLAATAILFDYLCIVTTAYYRYGIIVELLYGLVMALALVITLAFWRPRIQPRIQPRPRLRIPAYLLILLLLWPAAITFRNIFVRGDNLSWHDYRGLLHDGATLRHNAGLWFRDYDRIDDPHGALTRIDAFVTMAPFPKDGLAKLLNPRVPIYDLLDYGRTPELTNRFEMEVIRPDSVHNLVTVTYPGELSNDTSALRLRGYGVTHIDTVYPRFMKAGQPVFLLGIRYLQETKAKK